MSKGTKFFFTLSILLLIPLLTWFPANLDPAGAGSGHLNVAAAPIEKTAPLFDEAGALLANEQNTIDIIEQIGPSVVAINVSVPDISGRSLADLPPEMLPPELRDILPYLGDETPDRQGSGSGFLIRNDGFEFLITNFHVVQDSLQPGTTRLIDGATITAVFPEHGMENIPVRVVGANPSFDLALLVARQPTHPFPEVDGLGLADSDAVHIGQKAIAIGNPFGLEFTVTTGIVSAVKRFVPSVGQISIPMIQTDASINPGNSGGPLLNSRGELIGINTAILNPNGRSSAGVGFAVPSNLLVEALANLELGGLSDIRSTRPALGASLRTVTTLPPGLRELLELPAAGVVVIEVLPGSPAAKAGLRGSQRTVVVGDFNLPAGGDVITAVNGQPLVDTEQLNLLVTYEGKTGDQLELTLLRNSEVTSATVTLELLD